MPKKFDPVNIYNYVNMLNVALNEKEKDDDYEN